MYYGDCNEDQQRGRVILTVNMCKSDYKFRMDRMERGHYHHHHRSDPRIKSASLKVSSNPEEKQGGNYDSPTPGLHAIMLSIATRFVPRNRLSSRVTVSLQMSFQRFLDGRGRKSGHICWIQVVFNTTRPPTSTDLKVALKHKRSGKLRGSCCEIGVKERIYPRTTKR